MVRKWHHALDSPGRMVRMLLLDFSKAFDTADHRILLDKLSKLGLPNFIIEWITAFLCDRKHSVKIGQVKSEWAGMNAGVPQGTLLGSVGFFVSHKRSQNVM